MSPSPLGVPCDLALTKSNSITEERFAIGEELIRLRPLRQPAGYLFKGFTQVGFRDVVVGVDSRILSAHGKTRARFRAGEGQHALRLRLVFSLSELFVNTDYSQNQFALVRESELLMDALVVGLDGAE